VKDEEYRALHRRLRDPEDQPGSRDAPNLYGWEAGWIDRADGQGAYRVLLATTGRQAGVAASQATVATVERWHPRYVVLVGIAGGFEREGCTLGDVVVSTIIHGYGYGRLAEVYQVRPRGYEADGALLTSATRYRAVKPDRALDDTPYRVLLGPVASGDVIVDDPSNAFFDAATRVFPDLLAVEMEGAGAASAIQHLRDRGVSVGFIMVRGISDMPKPAASGAQKQERDRNLERACATAADFTTSWIASGWPVRPEDHGHDERLMRALRALASSAEGMTMLELTNMTGLGADELAEVDARLLNEDLARGTPGGLRAITTTGRHRLATGGAS
jgi:nucleoside phosphorylase